MAFHMVHTQGRYAPGKRQRPRASAAHQQRTYQAGAGGIDHAVDITLGHASAREYFPHQRYQALHVITRRQLGYDAAVHPMQIDLTEQGVRQQPALAVVERNAGFIAGSFYTQNTHNKSATDGHQESGHA